MSSQEDEVPNELNERLVQESESEESNNGASFNGAVFNLTTTIIGAGIMALPATMKILGIVPGIVMIILKAFLTDTTIEFLLRFSGGIGSYGALMEDSFGRPGRIALQVAVLVSNIGVLIVYMIIIGTLLLSSLLSIFALVVNLSCFGLIKVMFCTLCLKIGVEKPGGTRELLFFSLQLYVPLLHSQPSSALVSIYLYMFINNVFAFAS